MADFNIPSDSEFRELREIDQLVNSPIMGEVLRFTLDEAPEAILIRDMQSRIIFANKLAPNLFGYAVNQLRGMNFEELLPERYRQTFRKERADYWAHDPLGRMLRQVLIVLPAPRMLPGEKVLSEEVNIESHAQAFRGGNGVAYIMCIFRLVPIEHPETTTSEVAHV
jgi:PAS domain-containing protein